jgi:hypothetical protein
MRVLLPDWRAAKISSPPRGLETLVRPSVSRLWEDQQAFPATRPCGSEQRKRQFDGAAILHRHLRVSLMERRFYITIW